MLDFFCLFCLQPLVIVPASNLTGCFALCSRLSFEDRTSETGTLMRNTSNIFAQFLYHPSCPSDINRILINLLIKWNAIFASSISDIMFLYCVLYGQEICLLKEDELHISFSCEQHSRSLSSLLSPLFEFFGNLSIAQWSTSSVDQLMSARWLVEAPTSVDRWALWTDEANDSNHCLYQYMLCVNEIRPDIIPMMRKSLLIGCVHTCISTCICTSNNRKCPQGTHNSSLPAIRGGHRDMYNSHWHSSEELRKRQGTIIPTAWVIQRFRILSTHWLQFGITPKQFRTVIWSFPLKMRLGYNFHY